MSDDESYMRAGLLEDDNDPLLSDGELNVDGVLALFDEALRLPDGEQQEDAIAQESNESSGACTSYPDYPWLSLSYDVASQLEAGTTKKTEIDFKCFWKPWVDFCVSKGLPPFVPRYGLNLYLRSAAAFTSDNKPSAEVYETAIIIEFFQLLVAKKHSLRNVTKAIGFFNAHLKVEFLIRQKEAGFHSPALGNASVGHLPQVKATKTAAAQGQTQRNRDEFMNIQSNMDTRVNEFEIRAMLEAALDPPGRRTPVDKMCDLYKIIFGATFCSSQQIAGRGEDQYKQYLHYRFYRYMRHIGPGQAGTLCSYIVLNEAKHNKVGRCEYTAAAPHADPLRDSSFWYGVLVLYRVCCNNFRFPSFLDFEGIFPIPTYPSKENGTLLKREMYRDIWANFFQTCGVVTPKLTTIWRIQASQEMDEAGCDGANISRMTRHQAPTNCQANSSPEAFLSHESTGHLCNPASRRRSTFPRDPRPSVLDH